MRGSVLGIKFPYSQQRPNGSYRYRRTVPPELVLVVGRGEITRSLGASKKEAIQNWGAVHREVEAILADARRVLVGQNGSADGFGDSALAEHKRLERRLREASFDPDEQFIDHDSERSLLADALVDSYPVDPVTGEAAIPERDITFIRALNNGLPPPPIPTLKDAATLYLADKAKTDSRKDVASRQRVDRVLEKALDVLGGDRRLDRIRRADALKIRDRLLADYKTKATARRYLTPLKALVKYALWQAEHDKAVSDPFAGVTIVVDGNPLDNRRPFTAEELAAIREHVRASGSADLFDIWTVLELTGCRLSEVRGLDRQDVFLDANPCPYIRVRWTDIRRLKTKASDRDVPLHPDAVAALRRALERSATSSHVFPAYTYDGAGEALSAALMKHVRAVTDDPKAVVHSLRHNMEDRLLIAGVEAALADRFLGHGSSESRMRRVYGGREGLLRAKAAALAKAFPKDFPPASA